MVDSNFLYCLHGIGHDKKHFVRFYGFDRPLFHLVDHSFHNIQSPDFYRTVKNVY